MATDKIDDRDVADIDGLLRRIPNWPNMVKYDHNNQIERPSSACFSDRSTGDKEVSITLEKDLLESGGTHQDVISNHSGFGLAIVQAGIVRHDINPAQIINKQATVDDDYHGLIIGNKPKKTKTALAKNSALLIIPEITS